MCQLHRVGFLHDYREDNMRRHFVEYPISLMLYDLHGNVLSLAVGGDFLVEMPDFKLHLHDCSVAKRLVRLAENKPVCQATQFQECVLSITDLIIQKLSEMHAHQTDFLGKQPRVGLYFPNHTCLSAASHLQYFNLLTQHRLPRACPHVPDLPTHYSLPRKITHHTRFHLLSKANQQPSTCLRRITLQQSEILHDSFDTPEMPVDGKCVNYQINSLQLSLGKVVCMTQNSKSSYISASMCSVLPDQVCTYQTQSAHLTFSTIVSLQQITFRYFLKDLAPLLWISLEPLHCIYRQSRPERLRENNHISCFCVIRHDELMTFHDGNCATSHDRPLIVDSLPPSNLCPSLHSSIGEALDHESCRDILLKLIHLRGDPQYHQDFLDVSDPHGVQI